MNTDAALTAHPALDALVLGAGALFDTRRQAMATRLTVMPQRPDAVPDLAGLREELDRVWPSQAGPLLLSLASEAGLQALVRSEPPPHWLIEVPAFLLVDPALCQALRERVAQGQVLVLSGRVAPGTPADALSLFRFALVSAADSAGAAGPVPVGAGGRPMARLVVDAPSVAEAAALLKAGANAIVGWPLGDPPGAGTRVRAVPAGVQTVVDLMQRVEREEPADRLEAVVRTDPSLAFRLMRYINSPGFGLSVEISSFRHALMILGYQRLKRWLALLVTTAIDDPDLKPLMFMAVRRGLLMEELGRPAGDDALRNELFICGVFSLLDRMLQQPLSELVGSVPVPERVQQTLLGDNGPYEPYLALVRAVEQETAYDIRECADQLLLGPAEVNRAVLAALRGARQLDG